MPIEIYKELTTVWSVVALEAYNWFLHKPLSSFSRLMEMDKVEFSQHNDCSSE